MNIVKSPLLNDNSLAKYVLLLFFSFIVTGLFAQNTPPIAIDDVNTVDQDTVLNISAPGVLGNDTDADADTLQVTSLSIDGTTYVVGSTITLAEGVLIVNADGSYSFNPTAGYNGIIPVITYTISDGTDTTTAVLLLTVEMLGDKLNTPIFYSCNQGYTADGLYAIRYQINLTNTSVGRGYHDASYIRNIQIKDNLDAVFGDLCVTAIERTSLATQFIEDFEGGSYPQMWNSTSWDDVEFNETDATPGADGLFNAAAVANNILYPRQSLYVRFCIYVDPSCAGIANVDFDNSIEVTSSSGDFTENLLLTDFHTTETTVAAKLFVPEEEPTVNNDATYDFVNTVIIKNDGTATALDVNYNMGLQNFITNGVTFTSLIITQVEGTPVSINAGFDGENSTELLAPSQSLNAGETIRLEIAYIIAPINDSVNASFFSNINPSMTQGAADGFDETIAAYLSRYSFVKWSDALGHHVDRYYSATSATDIPSSNDQCACDWESMKFFYTTTFDVTKSILSDIPATSGVIENRELTFNIQVINDASSLVQVENIVLTDDLNVICGGQIVAVSSPVIVNSTALVNPNLNPSFNGLTDIDIFDGNSGILEPGQSVDVQFTVEIADPCSGENIASLSGVDPLNTLSENQATVVVAVFVDTDNDGISNTTDIDDDNDGITDVLENNGLDHLSDSDADGTPDYLDSDAPGFIDINNDGLNDLYDFDLDGVLNHLDLDADNDGIFDIVEAGNGHLDTNQNGMTNGVVGLNGLENTLENNDSFSATINYTIPNTDTLGGANFMDIDSDNDGIVDNIESQTTDDYRAPILADANVNGVDDAYDDTTNWIDPVDKDSDAIPDYLDTDTDADLREDSIEGWDTNNDGVADTLASGTDSDHDGLDDNFDTDDSQINPTNSQVPTDFPNLDITATPERDWRERLAPSITITDASIEEGGILVFTISLSSQSETPIAIHFSTTDITASISNDYSFDTSGVILTIPAGDTTATLEITTIDDTITELVETFQLDGTVTSANTTSANFVNTGEILDNEPLPTISISNPIEEEGKALEFTISLSNPNYEDIVIDITTEDDTAFTPLDYTSMNTTVTIPTNETSIIYEVLTIDDNFAESEEELFLRGVVVGGITDNTDPFNKGIITDNDFPNLFSPNGDSRSDVFKIVMLHSFLDFKIQIFDRWGSLVYKYENDGNPEPKWWDGKSNVSTKQDVPAGVYYYIIEFNDGNKKPKNGFVQLIR